MTMDNKHTDRTNHRRRGTKIYDSLLMPSFILNYIHYFNSIMKKFYKEMVSSFLEICWRYLSTLALLPENLSPSQTLIFR